MNICNKFDGCRCFFVRPIFFNPSDPKVSIIAVSLVVVQSMLARRNLQSVLVRLNILPEHARYSLSNILCPKETLNPKSLNLLNARFFDVDFLILLNLSYNVMKTIFFNRYKPSIKERLFLKVLVFLYVSDQKA